MTSIAEQFQRNVAMPHYKRRINYMLKILDSHRRHGTLTEDQARTLWKLYNRLPIECNPLGLYWYVRYMSTLDSGHVYIPGHHLDKYNTELKWYHQYSLPNCIYLFMLIRVGNRDNITIGQERNIYGKCDIYTRFVRRCRWRIRDRLKRAAREYFDAINSDVGGIVASYL